LLKLERLAAADPWLSDARHSRMILGIKMEDLDGMGEYLELFAIKTVTKFFLTQICFGIETAYSTR